MNTKIIVSIGFVLLVTVKPILSKSWREIVPLESTRIDVERLLGKPTDPQPARYYLPDEIVTVGYSQYACGQAPQIKGWPTFRVRWNVKPDVVTVIGVDLRKPVPLSSLHLDLSSFERVAEMHLENVFYYKDEKDGFVIEVYQDGENQMVRGYTYEPEAKYNNLLCPGIKRDEHEFGVERR